MDKETRLWVQQERGRMQRILNRGSHEPRRDLFDFTVPGDDEQGTLKQAVRDIAGGAFGDFALHSGPLDQELRIEMGNESDAHPDD